MCSLCNTQRGLDYLQRLPPALGLALLALLDGDEESGCGVAVNLLPLLAQPRQISLTSTTTPGVPYPLLATKSQMRASSTNTRARPSPSMTAFT